MDRFRRGKNTLSKIWCVFREEKLTSYVKRKVKVESSSKQAKLPRCDLSATKVPALMAHSSIENNLKVVSIEAVAEQSVDKTHSVLS